MDRKRHLTVVMGLVGLSCLVQAVRIGTATVPALDAVRFVDIAKRIDAQGLLATIRHEREQPLFPAWVWLVHAGVARSAGEFRAAWAASVQLAAAIPLVAAVVPVYFLSVRLVGSTAALAGGVFFCVLPEVSRLGADGLADSTHLLFLSLAIWAAVVHLTDRVRGSGFRWQTPEARGRTPGTSDHGPELGNGNGTRGQGLLGSTPREAGSSETAASGAAPSHSAALRCPASRGAEKRVWLLASGAFGALAVLARVEALVFFVALAATLTTFRLQASRRRSWPRLAASLGCLVLGAGLVFGPYLAAVRATGPAAAVDRILGRYQPGPDDAEPSPTAAAGALEAGVWQLADAEPMSFAPKETTTSLRRRGYLAATVQWMGELADAFGYLIGVFALFGAWRLRRVLRRRVDRFAHIYVLLFSLAVVHFAAREGYLSARHLLSLVVLGIGCAGYGALELGRWLADRERGGRAKPRACPTASSTLLDKPAVPPRADKPAVPPRPDKPEVPPRADGPAASPFKSLSKDPSPPTPLPASGARGAGFRIGTKNLSKNPSRPTPLPASGAREAGFRIGTKPLLAWTPVLLAAAVYVAEMAEPLHVARLGHRQAAEWLAERADASGAVIDTRGWTALYSGRLTYPYADAQAALADPRLAYVVVERRELAFHSARSRTLRRLLQAAATPVATFPDPGHRRSGRHEVTVYRWSPERFSRACGKARRRPRRQIPGSFAPLDPSHPSGRAASWDTRSGRAHT